ncbi:hypothetical protein [Oerskovia jenensis]|uniref:hypothetical protein n=1 Tax=Oerskovia jenensis TaxID=162169 RepID=UPI0036DD538A
MLFLLERLDDRRGSQEVWRVFTATVVRGWLALVGVTAGLLWVLVAAAIIFEEPSPSLDDVILGSIIAAGGILFILRVCLAGARRREEGVLVRSVLSSTFFGAGSQVMTRTEFHPVLPVQFSYIYLVDPDGVKLRLDALARPSFLEKRNPIQPGRESVIRSWL